jgi:hypothetical protein
LKQLTANQGSAILLLALGVALSTGLSFLLANPWATPFLGAAGAYPSFISGIRSKQYSRVAILMLVWGVFQSIAVGLASAWFPETAAVTIARGPAAAAELFHWIETGEGAEGSIRLFLPIHLRNYVVFCGLCCLTVSSAALLFGTYMLNYMNFYVAQLVTASAHPALALVVGWPIWSILRVIGFILTGVALAVVGLNLLARLQRQPPRHLLPRRFLRLGIAFVIADIVVKASLAPLWRQMLHYALFGAAD